jgi:hypothetical protein
MIHNPGQHPRYKGHVTQVPACLLLIYCLRRLRNGKWNIVQDSRFEAKIAACILNLKEVHSAIASLLAV